MSRERAGGRCRRRGFTLVEVLVSFMVFGLLGIIVALSMRAYAANQLKGEFGSDRERALSVTAGRLEALLRGCRVVSPTPGETLPSLEFQAPAVTSEGLLEVGANGQPVWQSAQQVTLVDGACQISGDEPIVVGRLGPLAALSFERRGPRVLSVEMAAGWPAAEAVEKQSAKFNLVLSVSP